MAVTLDLTTATPAQIDTLWFPLMAEKMRARHRLEAAVERLQACSHPDATPEEDAVRAARQALATAKAAEVPYEAEWNRRGSWMRYFHCTERDGHTHRTYTWDCPTLRSSTRGGWVAEFSGLTVDDLIARVGDMACTVCFPEAPVNPLFQRAAQERIRRTAAEKRIKKATARAKLARKVEHAQTRLQRAQKALVGFGYGAETRRRDLAEDAPYTAVRAAYDVEYADDDIKRAQQDVDHWDRLHPGYAETVAEDAVAVARELARRQREKLQGEIAWQSRYPEYEKRVANARAKVAALDAQFPDLAPVVAEDAIVFTPVREEAS